MSAAPSKAKPSFFGKLFAFFASFGLATVVLVFLLLITFLGTLEQVEHGLYDSQRKYFESAVIFNVDLIGILKALNYKADGEFIHSLARGVSYLPLPGGFLLMVILFINMLCGAIIRIRKNWRTLGVIIAHASILFLLIAGFVEFFMKTDGNMALLEGQTSDEYQSYHQSVIEIERLQPVAEEGKRLAWVIPGRQYQDLLQGRARTFTQKDLPFDLIVMNYELNAEPRKATEATKGTIIDGYYLQPQVKNPTSEMNLDGAYVKVIDKKTKQEQMGLIWRAEAAPWSVKVGDEIYGISIPRRTFKLPFAVKLDRFERQVYAGTDRAKTYTSYITKLSDGKSEKKVITMNQPLRDNGQVLFQASFGQERGEAGGPMVRSVFAVVSNPSDNWPWYAFLVATFGLLLHMVMQLFSFLVRQARRKESQTAKTPPPIPPGSSEAS